ncbi:hypothetical protein Hanom_Chr13g01191001 [Helianthus anomalus]
MNSFISGVISGVRVISDSAYTVPVVVLWETESSERRREICFKGPVSNTILTQNRQQFCVSCSGVSIWKVRLKFSKTLALNQDWYNLLVFYIR